MTEGTGRMHLPVPDAAPDATPGVPLRECPAVLVSRNAYLAHRNAVRIAREAIATGDHERVAAAHAAIVHAESGLMPCVVSGAHETHLTADGQPWRTGEAADAPVDDSDLVERACEAAAEAGGHFWDEVPASDKDALRAALRAAWRAASNGGDTDG